MTAHNKKLGGLGCGPGLATSFPPPGLSPPFRTKGSEWTELLFWRLRAVQACPINARTALMDTSMHGPSSLPNKNRGGNEFMWTLQRQSLLMEANVCNSGGGGGGRTEQVSQSVLCKIPTQQNPL